MLTWYKPCVEGGQGGGTWGRSEQIAELLAQPRPLQFQVEIKEHVCSTVVRLDVVGFPNSLTRGEPDWIGWDSPSRRVVLLAARMFSAQKAISQIVSQSFPNQIFKPCVTCHSLQVTLLMEFCDFKSFYSINSVSWACSAEQLIVTDSLPIGCHQKVAGHDYWLFQPSLVNRYARPQESYPVLI